MTSNAPIAIDVVEVDSQSAPAPTDASLAPLEPPSSHLFPSSRHRQSRKREMDNGGNSQMDGSFGQFSFAPATQTTVVTTTTTTTTTFPPLIIKPPRATRNLDTKLYPLAASPTPDSLRNIKFELGGKSVVFNEPEDTLSAVNETRERNDALKTSNGLLRSVASFTTSNDAGHPRRNAHPRLSSQPSSHPSGSKRRPVSPVSIPEAQPSIPRTRSRIPSEPALRSSRTRAPAVDGLATPETENNSFSAGSAFPRRIHSAALPRRASNLRSPLSSEVESQGTLQGSNPKSFLGMDAARARFGALGKSPRLDRGKQVLQDDLSARVENEEEGGEGEGEEEEEGEEGEEEEGEEEEEEEEEETAAPTSKLSDNVSVQIPQQRKLLDTNTQRTAADNVAAQDMCLPSPSLSPVAAMNAMNADSSFESTEDAGVDTDSSLDNNHVPRFSKSADVPRPTASLMDMPNVLDFFDSVPEGFKTYLMYQLLRRCPKPTLRFVANVVNPALKCNFLSMLPLELSLNIVKYFDAPTMCRAAQVSKKWRHIINSDEKTWKELLDRDGYVLPEGELERAIREGWGWQSPNGDEDFEKDLTTSLPLKSGPGSSASASLPAAGHNDRMLVTRQSKRKAATRTSTRKHAKRKISSSGTDRSETPDWRVDIATAEGPYAAASAAAAAVPYPDVGLSSLRSLHLYKSLYQRHHCIHKGWMKPDVRPKHFAFRAHDRHVVTCLQFDTDKILTGSDDTNINVYDTKTGALRNTLEGHEGGVWALEYYGNTLVSGSTDRSVRVWDIERARCTQIFHGHTSTVRCLQIVLPSEVGKRADGAAEMMPKVPLIITGSRDSNLRVWKLPRPSDQLYFQSGPQVDDADCPYFVRALTGHQHSVRAIAAHGDTLVSGSYDCTVRVWRISTGETVHRLQGHTSKVYSVVLDHERNRCISGSMDNLVKVWSLETGSLLYNLEGHTSLVGLLDLKCDRLVSAAADSTLRIWDPETGRCKSMLSAHTGAITCFQHDGQKVISGSDQTLKMWDVQTGEHVRNLLTDLSGVWQVKFNDRRCVAAVQRDSLTYIEVLDFGASRDGEPPEKLGKRIVVNRRGLETGDYAEEDYDMSDG